MKGILFFIGICVAPIFLFGFQPVGFIQSNTTTETLINSVSFHPKKNLFCVTFTHQHKVGLYQIDTDGSIQLMQMLENSESSIETPQNALFSPDGSHLVVVSWSTRNFNVYSANQDGHFQSSPHCVLPCKLSEEQYRPHGMSFSPDGNYLAVVYGSFEDFPWIVVLYRVVGLGSNQAQLIPCSTVKKGRYLKGVPKGVAFSPDGSSLAITFTVTDSVVIFAVEWEKEKINPMPQQEISGGATKLSRPEDIAFSPDGTVCAVSNSKGDTVSFYQYDKTHNRFISDIPFEVLGAGGGIALHFPHGLAFSHDGKYFAVTQFGLITCNSLGYITSWGTQRMEGIAVFRTED